LLLLTPLLALDRPLDFKSRFLAASSDIPYARDLRFQKRFNGLLSNIIHL
jgi:hypothetical protein